MKTYGPEGWDEQQATLPTHGYAFHQCSPVTSAVAVVPGWLLEVAGGPGSSSSPTQLPKCRLSSQPHHPRKRRRIGAATPSSHQPIRHLDRGGNTSLSKVHGGITSLPHARALLHALVHGGIFPTPSSCQPLGPWMGAASPPFRTRSCIACDGSRWHHLPAARSRFPGNPWPRRFLLALITYSHQAPGPV